jgi:hypothetical protein
LEKQKEEEDDGDEATASVAAAEDGSEDGAVLSQRAIVPQARPVASTANRGLQPLSPPPQREVLPSRSVLDSPSSSDSEQPATPLVTDEERAGQQAAEKLNQVFRLYAASTQHLVGVKIATPEAVATMDVAALRHLKQTLGDLVAARNHLLVRTLGEREVLRNEIHLKKTVLKPVIDMVLAHSLESHPSSYAPSPRALSQPATPSGPPRSFVLPWTRGGGGAPPSTGTGSTGKQRNAARSGGNDGSSSQRPGHLRRSTSNPTPPLSGARRFMTKLWSGSTGTGPSGTEVNV